MALDENHLSRRTEGRKARERVFDVPAFVAGRNDDGQRRPLAHFAEDRTHHGNGHERQPSQPGNRRHHDVQQRPEPEEVPRQIGNRALADELESRQPGELDEIRPREKRDDRRALTQSEQVRKPVNPREIPVIERHDNPVVPRDVRPHGFEEPLDVGRVIEISVEEKHRDAVASPGHVREPARSGSELGRRVHGGEENSGVSRQRIDVDDTVGVTAEPGDLARDERVRPLPKMTGKCETQTANASIQIQQLVRIAFIVQRYGTEILGGPEYACRLTAERLAERHDVDVLTTCARDPITWKNEYAEGSDRVRGVTVRRFASSQTRDFADFTRFTEWILQNPHDAADEMEWLKKQGPWSPGLIEYLKRHYKQYEALVFYSYLYAPTVLGLQIDPGRSILVPVAHDEPPIHLSIYRDVFRAPKAIGYLSEPERKFVDPELRSQCGHRGDDRMRRRAAAASCLSPARRARRGG